MIAKRIAILAHRHAPAAELIVAGSIEQTGQHSQNRSHEIHQTLSQGCPVSRSRSADGDSLSHILVALSPALQKVSPENPAKRDYQKQLAKKILPIELASSGKSPAYVHRRKN
jgi:hypothetical protein